MRYALPAAVLALVAVAHAAEGDISPYLLKAGESPRKGWSVVIFQTESVFSGGRIKVGNSDTCSSVDTVPCHFAVPDGPASILIDQALEYGDTTATFKVSGQRVYVIKSIQNTGRAAARAFGGVLGAVMSQPDDPPPTAGAQPAKTGESGPLANVRKGSRFDMEFISMSEPGKAGEFVTPPEK